MYLLNKEFVKKIAISVQWNSSNWLALLARSVTQGIKYPHHDQGVKQQYVGRPTESQFGLISDKYLQSFYANFLVRSQLAWFWQLSLWFVTINNHAESGTVVDSGHSGIKSQSVTWCVSHLCNLYMHGHIKLKVKMMTIRLDWAQTHIISYALNFSLYE